MEFRFRRALLQFNVTRVYAFGVRCVQEPLNLIKLIDGLTLQHWVNEARLLSSLNHHVLDELFLH